MDSVGKTSYLFMDHAVQYVHPELAIPVALPAQGGAYAYGATTEVVAASAIGTDYGIHEILISAMSANANFVIKVMYGGSDTIFGYVTITRGGVQTQSVAMPIRGPLVPADDRIRMALADSVGTSTLAVKITYHLMA